jgi:hypothetical protein
VQTVCSPAGELLWAAAPQLGATADVTAARKAGIAGNLTSLIGVLADLGYLGWDKEVLTGRLASDDVTQINLDIRGYIDTARKHGLGAYEVLHQLMLSNPWLSPAQPISP